jgi:endoglucanase
MRLITLIAAALALLMPNIAAAQGKGPAWETATHLKRGVNIIGYDPLWRDPARARFQTRHFGIIKAGGFDFVRVVLSGFRHMDADNKLSPQFFTTLDWVVKEASAAGLSVILDEHDFTFCATNADSCETKLVAFWQQVGEHYQAAPRTTASSMRRAGTA